MEHVNLDVINDRREGEEPQAEQDNNQPVREGVIKTALRVVASLSMMAGSIVGTIFGSLAMQRQMDKEDAQANRRNREMREQKHRCQDGVMRNIANITREIDVKLGVDDALLKLLEQTQGFNKIIEAHQEESGFLFDNNGMSAEHKIGYFSNLVLLKDPEAMKVMARFVKNSGHDLNVTHDPELKKHRVCIPGAKPVTVPEADYQQCYNLLKEYHSHRYDLDKLVERRMPYPPSLTLDCNAALSAADKAADIGRYLAVYRTYGIMRIPVQVVSFGSLLLVSTVASLTLLPKRWRVCHNNQAQVEGGVDEPLLDAPQNAEGGAQENARADDASGQELRACRKSLTKP